MCSFEVSIGLLPLILIVSSKESLLKKSCENPINMEPTYLSKSAVLEGSLELSPLTFDCLIKRIPIIEVSRKAINIEPRYLTKCALFEVSIGLVHLILIVSSKESLL